MIDYAAAWRERLQGRGNPEFARFVDVFETQIELKKQGKIDDKLFAETRLRLGLYGQRYDNGHRFDGLKVRALAFPAHGLKKGPDTEWDAPGMVRIKIPYGGVNPEQLEAIAELSEEYADGVSHVTTRQDIQLHFVHIENTPMLMRRLAAVGITTREACGNSVRNVTACQVAGVCGTEAFDVTPYATALYRFLLGHPDTMEFGRKFKIAFSGCGDRPCALTNLHDLGCVARTEVRGGKTVRGFKVVVGGGLGAVPHEARTLYDFLPEDELLPVSQAVSRVFGRLGEKANRALARIKFLVAKLGIEEFKRLVEEERKVLRPDPRWRDLIEEAHGVAEHPSCPPRPLAEAGIAPAMAAWLRTNTLAQSQEGYATVVIRVPLGDLSADQMRGLAAMARRYTSGTVRFSIEQNVVFRWISRGDLPDFHKDLVALGLDRTHAGTIADVTACPGTDTCKLGTSSSRGLAHELMKRFESRLGSMDADVEQLKIKVSGCFNSCGQHHVAQLGFYGVSRKKDGRSVPHFQVVLGGRFSQDPGSYGLPIAAIPSKNVPAFVDRILEAYQKQRAAGESFSDYIARLGKKEVRALLQEFIEMPGFDAHPEFYSDWGESRLYSTDDKGTGECAGEVVSLFEFEIAESEREYFEGQLALERGDHDRAVEIAHGAMVAGAKALVRLQYRDVLNEPAAIAEEFRRRYVEAGLFSKNFAHYFFKSLASHAGARANSDVARQTLQEAHLFIEEAMSCRHKVALPTLPLAAAGGPVSAH